MTREILFRGKHLKTPVWGGERWVYGSYIDANDDHMIIPENAEYWGGTEFDSGFLISPETVGQYTSLKDKNGVRIFEGDIVQGSNCLHENRTKYVVAFDDGTFCLVDDHGTSWHHSYIDDKVVIGNVHDNPELLEGGNMDDG